MATLQTIRSKGPLLVVVIGLALFAFIAGDAWKVLQPHQGKQDVGEINGKTLTAQEYQKMVDEYAEVIKLTQGLNSLNDDQLTQVKDQVWQSYVNNQLIAAEAKKLGLTVSDAEIQAIIEEGTHPLLMQTPFRNPQTGAFDKDMLKKFLVDYANLGKSQMPAQYVEYYQKMGAFWNFIEKTLRQTALAEKYQNLLAKSLISNPVSAEDAFASRTNQTDVLLAAVPYSSINDSTITVSNEEIKALYNKKKETFEQPVETRNIKYIDVLVTPSDEDRKEVLDEVTEYSTQLANVADMSTFVRSTNSVVPFSEVVVNKTVLPNDIVARLDSVKLGEVYGPYYNQADDSYNAFRILAKQTAPDSIQFRQIQVYSLQIAARQLKAEIICNCPCILAIEFEEIPDLIQYNIVRMGFFDGVIAVIGCVPHRILRQRFVISRPFLRCQITVLPNEVRYPRGNPVPAHFDICAVCLSQRDALRLAALVAATGSEIGRAHV